MEQHRGASYIAVGTGAQATCGSTSAPRKNAGLRIVGNHSPKRFSRVRGICLDRIHHFVFHVLVAMREAMIDDTVLEFLPHELVALERVLFSSLAACS